MRAAIGTIALAAAAACNGGRSVPCEIEFGGLPWGEMPDLDMQVGDTVRTEVWRHFSPDWCPVHFSLSNYVAEWSDSAAVVVSVPDSILTIAALAAADSVLVTVWTVKDGRLYPDPVKDAGFHEFVVRVRPPPAGR